MPWWERSARSLEQEQAWFRQAGLLFELDRGATERRGVATFRGVLRYRQRRCAAQVLYPPGYTAGHHPVVVAPALPLSRHKGPDGTLCLDHPVIGDMDAMTGAEAAQRAERLWQLSEEDPDALRDEEAPAPDPRVDWYEHEPGSAIVIADADVSEHGCGYFRLGLTQVRPLRGALSAIGAGPNMEIPLAVSDANEAARGGLELCGLWTRLPTYPPVTGLTGFSDWVQREHGPLLKRALVIAQVESQRRRQLVPAALGFVFPDEVAHDEFADTWIIFTRDHTGADRLARVYTISANERWLRQPQLEHLGSRRVGLVGAGALGSPLAAHLSRAGVGDFFLVDSEVIVPGNRVRHECDLGDVGLAKVTALARRLLRLNPYADIGVSGVRLGAILASDPGRDRQEQARTIAELLRSDLIVNATASLSTGFHIAAEADAARRPVLHAMVSSGGWSGRILLQRHGVSGCLECIGWHQDHPMNDSPEVPEWTEDPDFPVVTDGGCAQITFTGPGFEIAETAAAAARFAVQNLLDGDGYPAAEFDMVTLRLRRTAAAETEAIYSKLPRHPRCTTCSDD